MDRSSGLSGDFVSDVFEDREGNLWVGTRAGLDRLRDGQVRTFTSREGLVDPGPIVADDSGGLWTLSDKKISRIATNKMKDWPVHLPSGSRPLTMLSSPHSPFWIGFDGGLEQWSADHAAKAPELAVLGVQSLLRAQDGSIWIGTENRGLLRWSPGPQTLVETGVTDKFISTLAEDHTGAIWAGSNHGGLYRVAAGNVQHFGPHEGLRSPGVYALCVDGKGDLWIGSTGGLSWFQEGQIRTVNSQQGLPADQVFAILDDSYGRLWLTGFGGIAAIEKKSLLEWATGQRQRLTPMVYRIAEGLQINTIGRVFPNAARSADGHLWFSTADGLWEVSEAPPPVLRMPRNSPVLIEEDAAIDRVSHTGAGLGSELRRVHAQLNSVIRRSRSPILSGSDSATAWKGSTAIGSDADARRVASYNNLKPGSYTFRVSARVGGEPWRESSALVLEQLPYFYQTRWFMLLASATALFLAFLVYRLRLQQAINRIEAGFQERMRERTRIAQELHDTVVQAIAGSTMLVENAAEKIPDSLPVVKGALLRAVDKLELALAESRAALKGLRTSGSPENNLAKQLSDVASDARTPDLAFRLLITGESRALRPVIQYEVFRIASEAIVNAYKHSGAKSLRVDLDYLNGLRILVRDDGRGMPEQVRLQGTDGHFGLAGMRERADRIGAALEVSSRAGEGTEVSLDGSS